MPKETFEHRFMVKKYLNDIVFWHSTQIVMKANLENKVFGCFRRSSMQFTTTYLTFLPWRCDCSVRLLAWSTGEVQHLRHESFSQGHLLAWSDKRQLFTGALSATLQGSIEKRGRHWAFCQIFYRYESNSLTHIHTESTETSPV